MHDETPIYILGAGAIGIALAAQLILQQKSVVLVRTSTAQVPPHPVDLLIRDSQTQASITVAAEVTALAQTDLQPGILVVTAKAHANRTIATQLATLDAATPLVLLQNGIGVEAPFLDAGFAQVLRCVLYATGQRLTDHDYGVSFRAIASSPIGVIRGADAVLQHCVTALNTPHFPFHATATIQADIWRKGIINAVFNTICPLLAVDNGIFARDPAVAALAGEVIGESIQVANALGITFAQDDLLNQVLQVSRGSDGQLISTLQDLQQGRETEIESLNLEIARVAESLTPAIPVPKTKLLGELVLQKSRLG